LDDPQQWIRYLDKPLATASIALADRWKAYVEAQRGRAGALAENAGVFKAAKEQADLIEDVLKELDKQFPPVAGGLPEQFAAAAFDGRERDLRALSEWAEGAEASPPDDLVKFAEQVTERGEAYKGWSGKLRSLAKDFPIAKELLTPTDRPDRAWAARDKAFWEDPIVQRLVRKDLDRIEAVARVATLPRAELEKTARTAEATEVVMAAWRRLGEPAQGAPPWPATADELAAEDKLRARLVPLINALKSEPDRKRIAAEWAAQGPVRWRRFTNGAVLAGAGRGQAGRRAADRGRAAVLQPRRGR
jgi:hypothetical protein